MPLTKKGKKIMAAMKQQYGEKKGKNVFYASAQKGVISGVEPANPHGMPYACGDASSFQYGGHPSMCSKRGERERGKRERGKRGGSSNSC